MNGYERIKAALQGRQPDRIPIMLHNFMMAAREHGMTMKQFRSNPKNIADCFIRSVEKYDVDAVLVDIDTATLAGALGVPIDFPDDEPARCSAPLLDDLKKVDDLELPHITKYPTVQVWLEAVSLLKEHFNDDIAIRGNCDQCPFSLASMVRTPSQWMMDLADPDNEEDILKLLNYCELATHQFQSSMAKSGADILSNGDSPAGPEMISPKMYRSIALPYETHCVELAHQLGKPYILHICGKTDSILDSMVQTGADGLELDYKTDIRKAHHILKDQVTFIGNIDPVNVLAMGEEKLVETKTRELLELFADTPRFILNAGCAIPASTPSVNIQAMIKTARDFL